MINYNKYNKVLILSIFIFSINLIITGISWSCPKPPGCLEPTDYAIRAMYYVGPNQWQEWARTNSVNKCVWTIADGVETHLRYEALGYRNGAEYSAPSYSDCGLCTLNAAEFTQSGGTFESQGSNDYNVKYTGQPLKGQVTAKHKGWACYKYPYGNFTIGGSGATAMTMDVYFVDVDITLADITQNKITVNLTPSTASGLLQVSLASTAGDELLFSDSQSGGSHDYGFNIPDLPERRFTAVVADWYPPNATIGVTINCVYCTRDYNINVLGNFEITNYGLTDEEDCNGNLSNFSYTIGDCSNVNCDNWSNTTGKSDWLSEVSQNGSGRGTSGNHFTVEGWCSGGLYTPKFRRIGSVTGCPKCSSPYKYMTVNETVAKWSSNGNIHCGDKLYLNGYGKKTATDTGSGDPNNPDLRHWLDLFIGYVACDYQSGTTNNIKVIRLVDECP